jgi:hypothetical protein
MGKTWSEVKAGKDGESSHELYVPFRTKGIKSRKLSHAYR